jgi:hypothetical protein
MNTKLYEEARDFAGADWGKLSDESHGRLLEGNKVSSVWKGHKWSQLPETVKDALTKSLMKKKHGFKGTKK